MCCPLLAVQPDLHVAWCGHGTGSATIRAKIGHSLHFARGDAHLPEYWVWTLAEDGAPDYRGSRDLQNRRAPVRFLSHLPLPILNLCRLQLCCEQTILCALTPLDPNAIGVRCISRPQTPLPSQQQPGDISRDLWSSSGDQIRLRLPWIHPGGSEPLPLRGFRLWDHRFTARGPSQ